jgi:membrane protein DedA with SNARE-associated domain
MLENLTEWIGSLSRGWLYAALFLSAYLENLIPPVPGDTVTLFAAFLVGRSKAGFLGVLLSTTAGSVAGFMTFYVFGRLIHPEYFTRKNFRLMPASSFEKAGLWFQRHGRWVILFNRFLSGIRSVISIVSGLYRYPWQHVLLLSALGCGLWNLMLIWGGYLLGSNWRRIEYFLTQYSLFLLFSGAAAALVWLWRARHRRASGRKNLSGRP